MTEWVLIITIGWLGEVNTVVVPGFSSEAECNAAKQRIVADARAPNSVDTAPYHYMSCVYRKGETK